MKHGMAMFAGLFLFAVLLLGMFACVFPVKAIYLNTTQDTVELSNEGPGYEISALVNAGYGNYNLYQALVAIQQNTDPSLSGIITDQFLAALASCPASSQIFTESLSSINTAGTAVAISTDGTVQTVSIYGYPYYYGGNPTLSAVVSGVGRLLAVHSPLNNTPLTSWNSTNSGITTTYNVLAILWNPSSNNTVQNSIVLSNEGSGYGISALVNAGYGSYDLYQALLAMQSNSDPSLQDIITDQFLAALQSCPNNSPIWTTTLRNYNSTGTSIAISTDGTIQTVNINGSSYYGATGSSALNVTVTGVGSYQAIYSATQNPLTTFTTDTQNLNVTYNVYSIIWVPSTTTQTTTYYNVTFTQIGLPSNTNWTVTLNGETKTSNQTTITFSVASGNYTYTITLPAGYASNSTLSGSISADSNKTMAIQAKASTSTPSPDWIYYIIAIIIAAIIIIIALVAVKRRQTKNIKRAPQ